MVDFVGWFWGAFPFSVIPLALPFIYIYFKFLTKSDAPIRNRVELFFKGGTKANYKCEIIEDVAHFTVGETEHKEPIIYHPRIEYDRSKGIIYRTFLFAEGIGSVDVPPLTQRDKKLIVEALVQEEIIPEEDRKDNIEDYTDEMLMTYVQFYNFDIEQVTDKPMLKTFSTAMNFFEHTVSELVKITRSMEGEGTSNFARLGYIAMGVMIGWGFAWAFTLKGII